MTTIETDGGFLRVQGTEADLCKLIAQRQAVGVAKYGTTLRGGQFTHRQLLQHALEENLDSAAYLLRCIEELDKAQPEHGLDKVIEPVPTPDEVKAQQRRDLVQMRNPYPFEKYAQAQTQAQSIANGDQQADRSLPARLDGAAIVGLRHAKANTWRPYDPQDDQR